MSDFAEETMFLVEKFFVEYQSENSKVKKSTICDFKNMFVVHAKLDKRIIFRGDNEIIFGDDSKQYHQTVFDYMLREGGETDSFKWKLIRMNR